MRCEIYAVGHKSVRHKNSFRWKWRYVAADGSIKESEEFYTLYYECVVAARSSGYEPPLRVA